MRESTIEQSVCAYAKAKGCLSLKLAGMNQRGQPDRLVIRDGKSLFIEFKAPGKRLTALQIKWLFDLTNQGMNAMWCDSIADGNRLIDRIFS